MRTSRSRAARFGRTPYVLLAVALAGGCTLPMPQATVPAVYDFGPERATRERRELIGAILLIPSVNAPTWLEGSGIVYRLLYEDGARPRVYSLSRWVAPPAEMLTDRVRDRFADVARAVITSGYGAREDYILRVELDNFSQQFDSPDRSRVVVRARATLVAGSNRTLVAQREFAVERRAEPNAAGAVKALTEGTNVFLDELVNWVAESVGEAGATKT